MQELTAELKQKIEKEAMEEAAFWVLREGVAGMAFELMSRGVKPSEVLGAVNDGFELAWKMICEGSKKSDAGH